MGSVILALLTTALVGFDALRETSNDQNLNAIRHVDLNVFLGSPPLKQIKLIF